MKKRRSWPVRFMIEGLNIERFVRCTAEKGVHLSRVRRIGAKRLTAQTAEENLPILEEEALRGGWRITTGQRKGIGHVLEWGKRRWLLCMALFAACTALFAASQFMWQIDIIDAGVYAADIRNTLTEMGIAAPMLRQNVALGKLRDSLEWRYPRIAWFECGWRGSMLVIRPEIGVLPRRDTGENGPCDVVASRDGVIHTIVTVAGTPAVQPGDVVRKGDVLIRGEERTSNGAVKLVAARGSVIARVWEGASVCMPAMETVTAYTGREENAWTIRTPWFDFWKMKNPDFACFDTSVEEWTLSSIFMPVKLVMQRYLEAEYTSEPRDPGQLEKEVRAAAMRKLYEKVGGKESLIDIWGNCSMIDAENLLSVAIGEMRVEIGTRRSASGMAAPGQDSADKEPR